MAKKKLFDIALESEKIPLGRELTDGYKSLLRHLVEKGPIQKPSIHPALEELVDNGYATKAVLNGPDEPEQVAATDKGLDLYNQIKTLDGFSEIEETDTDAVDAETNDANSEVSKEGFVDWLKDIFTVKFDQKDLNRFIRSISVVDELSKKNLRRKLFLDSWFFEEEEILSFFFKNGRVVDDIAAEIKDDVSTLKILLKSIDNLNNILGAVNFNTDEGTVRDLIESKFDRKLIDSLDKASLLHGILLGVGRNNKISQTDTIPDDFYDEETVITSTVYGPDGTPIGTSKTTVPEKKGRIDEYRYQANGSIKSNESVQAAFKEFAKFGNTAEKSLSDFLKNVERLKGSQTKAIRGFMRNGHNIVMNFYYVTLDYGIIAERLIEVNKKNLEY